MGHLKLHIPGPVQVSTATWQAMTTPMIGHRSSNFQDLYGKIQPQLQELLGTERLVYLSTSSAWGIMEGAIRNLAHRKLLCCMCGAFSDKWLDVASRCGIKAEGLQVEWGSPILCEAIAKKLASGDFDAITLVHNETSTGVMNPLEDIAKLKDEYPDVMFIVDSVTSMTAVPLHFDKLGIDVLLAGTQKAWALPPGFSVFVASDAAIKRSAKAQTRGYYFDFHEFQKNAERNMTPTTPSIPHINAMSSKLDEFFLEGLNNRYTRHLKTNQMIRDWAAKHGFTLFPESGYESVSLTCINNGAKEGGRIVDVPKLQNIMKEKDVLIDGGYGKLKGLAFRLSNMGDETEETMGDLISKLDASMEELS